MRVLLADKLADQAPHRLASLGFEVHADPSLKGEALVGALRHYDPDVLVVRSTRVEAPHVQAGASLSLVIRAGAGVNTIDLETCSRAGVFVANCPGRNAVAVAELTMGLLVALDRSIPDNVAELRAGQWNKATFSRANGLKGRTMGILGMGGIGTEVAARAKAFGMPVVAWSRSLTQERATDLGITFARTPEAVAQRAHVLSVHLALSDDTAGRIGRSVFEAMQPNTLFLNTSRAEVVDEDALRWALDEKGIRAGLDVFSDEPAAKAGPFEHPLARHPAVYGTHHIGASTTQAQEAVADAVCTILEHYVRTGHVPDCVNLASHSDADHVLVVRHLDQVGVLAGVLDLLREAGINVQEMENVLFEGGEAATARISVAGAPTDALLEQMRAATHVLHVAVVSRS